MENEKDLKMALGWNRWNMNVIGIWPDPFTNRKYSDEFKIIITITLLMLFATLPQNANLFFIWGDIELITENLSIANIPGINVLMKVFFTWRHRDALKVIMKTFYDNWYEQKTKEEQEIMRKHATISKNVSVWTSTVTLMMETSYITLRLFLIVTGDWEKERTDHLCIYPGYFPYDLRRIPFLVFTFIGQSIIGYMATIAYTTVDAFVAMLVIHIYSQFEIVKLKLERLMGDQNSRRNSDLIRKELAEIINKHECLNKFIATVEESFNKLLLIQMLLCTTEMCFQGFLFFNVILKSENGIFNVQMIFFVLFVMFILGHIYIYCYIGEMLIIQNNEVSNAAYKSSWYNVSPVEAKNLLIIMKRSHQPLNLTAGKFSVFSLELFSNIMKTAMGYLSVLLTVASND